MNAKKFRWTLLLCALAVNSASAIELRSGYGGPEGYGELAMLPNDDSSSNLLNLPFSIQFFGNTYNSFFVNNNGNVSFGSPLSAYTPSPFPIASQPMIAPYWGDVDTRSQPGGGAVYIASPSANSVVATWHNVGVYPADNSLINDFQMTLLDRSDTGSGNFDIEFRYNQLQWISGAASSGVAAQAGYDAGDLTHFFALPGSLTNGILQLANNSNVSASSPGLWTMAIRNGTTADGSSADAPLLPVIVRDGKWVFDFNINLNQQIFIDPLVAVGFDYVVESGPNIRTVTLPTVSGDSDGYDIYAFDILAGQYDSLLAHVAAGEVYDFGQLGIDRFGVRDIDINAALDPSNPTAFVTALTFVETGTVGMTMTPISVEVDASIPEPSSLVLLATALIALNGKRRRHSN